MTADRPRLGPGLALAAAGSVAFSAKAIIVKLAYRHDVDAVTLIMYRMLFALPLFVTLAWWAGRGRPPLARRDLAVVTGLGFSGYYLASSLDFAGLQYITASLERLILYLNPTIVLGLGWLLFRQRVSARQLLALAVSYTGVLLGFGHEVEVIGAVSALGAPPRGCAIAGIEARHGPCAGVRPSGMNQRVHPLVASVMQDVHV